MWTSFYESGFDEKISGDKIYVSYCNEGNNVRCCIGETATNGVKIPSGRWACFKLNTTDDEIVNEIYSKIIYEWLSSAKLIKNDFAPIVEVYPSDMSQEGFEWEIWMPVCQEK